MQRYVKKAAAFAAALMLLFPQNIFALEKDINLSEIAANALLNESSYLAEGNHEKWIDRLNFGENTYAEEFYKTLENSLSSNKNFLIDPTFAEEFDTGRYGIHITDITISGTAEPNNNLTSRQQAENIVNQASDKIYEKLSDVSLNASMAYYAFRTDHPEVFWLNKNISFTPTVNIKVFDDNTFVLTQGIYLVLKADSKNEQNDRADFTDIRYEKYTDPNAIYDAIAKRDLAVKSIISASPNGDTYQKVQYFNEYLTKINDANTVSAGVESGTASEDCGECITALLGKSGAEGPTCEGYAKALKVLCDNAGIPCVLAMGEGKYSQSSNAELHMWNNIQAENGCWYATDVTWNDPLVIENNKYIPGKGNENYLFVSANEEINGLAFSVSHKEKNAIMENVPIYITNGPKLSALPYSSQSVKDETGSQKTAYSTPNLTLTNNIITLNDVQSVKSAKIQVAYPNGQTYCYTKGTVTMAKNQNNSYTGTFKYNWQNAPSNAVLQARAIVNAVINNKEVTLVSQPTEITNN